MTTRDVSLRVAEAIRDQLNITPGYNQAIGDVVPDPEVPDVAPHPLGAAFVVEVYLPGGGLLRRRVIVEDME